MVQRRAATARCLGPSAGFCTLPCCHGMQPTAGSARAQLAEASALPDPCPLPGAAKKRALNERERLLYAPMADVGGLLYDKDAVYIDVPDWKARRRRSAYVCGDPANPKHIPAPGRACRCLHRRVRAVRTVRGHLCRVACGVGVPAAGPLAGAALRAARR